MHNLFIHLFLRSTLLKLPSDVTVGSHIMGSPALYRLNHGKIMWQEHAGLIFGYGRQICRGHTRGPNASIVAEIAAAPGQVVGVFSEQIGGGCAKVAPRSHHNQVIGVNSLHEFRHVLDPRLEVSHSASRLISGRQASLERAHENPKPSSSLEWAGEHHIRALQVLKQIHQRASAGMQQMLQIRQCMLSSSPAHRKDLA